MAPFFFFTLGLAVGSFLNVLIYRLPLGLGIRGRSFCPHCKKTIRWFDNVPLLSFLLLGGKCRRCHSPIGWQYPAVELITAALFVVTFSFLSSERIMNQESGIMGMIELLYSLLILSLLIVIFFIDLRHKIIPDLLVFPAIIVTFLYISIIHNSLFIIHFLAAIGAFAFFLTLFLFTRGRGMGFGDVKLAFLMGLILGFPNIVVALYLAFLTGAVVSIILVLRGRKRLKDAIAFGPFLVIGTFVAFFWGEQIVQLASRYITY